MEIYTIGFTGKTAAEFFGALRQAGIARLIDVRLNNASQLAGFTKRADLAFFLRELCNADYIHQPLLAPSKELLTAFRKKQISWEEYEPRFRALLAERKAEDAIDRGIFSVPAVLLCSEPTPEHCHRRLVAEYLREKWGDVDIVHL